MTPKKLSFTEKSWIYPVIAVFFFSQAVSFPAWSAATQVENSPASENNVPTISPQEVAVDSFGNVSTVDTPPSTLAQLDNPLSESTPESTLEASANVTTFPGQPPVTTFSNEAVVTVDQISSSQFKLNYDISTPGSFGGAIINFGASSAGAQDLSAAASYDFQIATDNFCAAGASCLKVEFLDAAGQLSVVNLNDLTSAPTDVTITQAELLAANPALDLTLIQQINFVVDENVAPTTKAGFYDIQAGGLAFTPTLTAAAPSAAPTRFPGTPAVTTFANQSTANVQTVSDTQFRVDYDVTTAGSFAGAIINYDPSATGTFQDLSGFDNLLFNLSTDNVCAGGKCLKIEIVDTANRVSAFNVQGLDATSKQITIPRNLALEANANLDLTHIKQINFVIEEGNTNPKAGFLNVEIGGFNGTTPVPNPNPNPNPEPEPEPNPNPNPNPQPGDVLFTGVSEGQTVAGVVTIAPDLIQIPDIRKVAYYLNGTKAGRAYDSPFTWGGTNGVDTSQLVDGEYELTAVYTTPAGDQTFTVRFSVNNGNPAPAELQPQPAPENSFTGLAANQTVDKTNSASVTVQPDLTVVPDVHKVFYYLDGTFVERVYEAPFTLDLDTEDLTPGPHVLSILYGTTAGDFLNSGEFTLDIPFTVEGAMAPATENGTSNTEDETTTLETETAAQIGAETLASEDASATTATVVTV